MNCTHHWNIDSIGNARCLKCGATKVFPREKIKLPYYSIMVTKTGGPSKIGTDDFKVDPSYWQRGSIHENIGG